jgi:4,5-DOPA dioxygenase extradiol
MNQSSTPSAAQSVLFVSHGSPMFALEHGSTAPALRAWAESLPVKPRGIVIMSPHWMAPVATVMSTPQPPTWHDFGGFPAALFQLQYPAPGDPALAQRVAALLQAHSIRTQLDDQRPFDHGAWVPMMHLFPQADVPVVQVALPTDYTPRSVWAIGQALRSLRQEGILIIGSGSMTHNLRELFTNGVPALDAKSEPYAVEFARWVEQAITQGIQGTQGDADALFDYRQHAPHAARAHPTDEHYAPLYFALGAAGWGTADAPQVHYLSREVMYRYLAMDAMVFN